MINHRKDGNSRKLISRVQSNSVIRKSSKAGSKAVSWTGDFFAGLKQSIVKLVRQYKRRQSQKIRRSSRERVYRLKGYTTVAKVNRKRQSERYQKLLRKFLFVIIALLVLVMLIVIYNPIKDLSEFKKMFGINSFSDLTGQIDESDSSVTTTTTTTIRIVTTEPADSTEANSN